MVNIFTYEFRLLVKVNNNKFWYDLIDMNIIYSILQFVLPIDFKHILSKNFKMNYLI